MDLAIEHHDRVHADDRAVFHVDRHGLASGVLARDLDRVPVGELVDVGDLDVEGDPELLEDRPALRAPAG
jgi:hypothetical protein